MAIQGRCGVRAVQGFREARAKQKGVRGKHRGSVGLKGFPLGKMGITIIKCLLGRLRVNNRQFPGVRNIERICNAFRAVGQEKDMGILEVGVLHSSSFVIMG